MLKEEGRKILSAERTDKETLLLAEENNDRTLLLTEEDSDSRFSIMEANSDAALLMTKKEEVVYSERTLLPGTILSGKYEIKKVIGEGGFGITYEGVDLNLQMKVAIKEYFPAAYATRSIKMGIDNKVHIIGGGNGKLFNKGLEDYAKEANRLAQFSSLSGIVSVLNFFYENDTAYMVMEFVDGVTLKEYLNYRNGKIEWRETLKLLHPVIQSLKQVHRAGIIHRDISPDNIMLTQNNEMILIDFGAARKIEENQKKNTVILKRAYAPLEQYQTEGNQGTWTDVYSMCSVIYRMVSGENVPDALSIASGSLQIKSLKSFISGIPEFLESTIKKGLETEISMRIQNMDELEGYLYKNERVKLKKKLPKTGILMILAIMITVSVLFFFLQKSETEKNVDVNIQDNFENQEKKDMKIQENNTEKEKNSLDAEYESMEDTVDLEYEITEEGVVITGVDYAVAEVVIPGNIGESMVTELKGMSPNATSVVIKNGLKKIAGGAFRNCVYLEKIYIPASVEVIESGAFENCLSLDEIIVSDNNPNFYSEDGKLYTMDGTIVFE